MPSLLALAVAFFVFFAAAAGAGVVAADFGGGADGFGWFGLGGAGLILQVLLLALLFAIELARDVGQTLRRRFVGASCGAGHCCGWSAHSRRVRRGGALWNRRCGSAGYTGACWSAGATLRFGRGLHVVGILTGLLNDDVEEIADRFVVDARHHVFEQDERFFFELDDRVFLSVAAEADAFFQVIEREQGILPLRIDHIENDAALQPAHQFVAELFFFLFVALDDRFFDRVGKLFVRQLGGVSTRCFSIDAKLCIYLGQELRRISLARVLGLGA